MIRKVCFQKVMVNDDQNIDLVLLCLKLSWEVAGLPKRLMQDKFHFMVDMV